MIDWVTIIVSAGVPLLIALMGACAYRMNRNRQSCRIINYGHCRYSCFCEQEEETHRDEDRQHMLERHRHEVELLVAEHKLEVGRLNRQIEQLLVRIRMLRNHVRQKRQCCVT